MRITIFRCNWKARRLEKKIKKMEGLGYKTTQGHSPFEEIYRPQINRLRAQSTAYEILLLIL